VKAEAFAEDVRSAATFYRALGLLLTRENHGGPEHYAADAGGVVFEIYPLTLGKAPTTDTRLGFVVDDVVGLLPLLTAAGGRILTEAPDRAVVADPDGHRVELTRRLR
jgi:catechol 2,3-dioxygenase-like lactoylglutathione lyase family enzyme